ncbi:DUF4232 domain-containing protein [Amycolatopsis sp. H20-H5]|uniref:DUF4232 domain-containing protein n=1 Tax=Amycolatopsis sp. H20-H5 TaxID=3046309 RepID=UPI002DBD76DF|nr:DUF4232 domain-containing protein [Amycolatopsis sp. H20-H5]MEC3975727.1 DUF4232 domain-containing protein [Amycolatopsis sp. H20-H5]
MTTRTIVRRSLAAVAVAGVVAGATALSVGAASADNGYGPNLLPCTSNQFTTALVEDITSSGERDAAIQFTAKVGERCFLQGVPNVEISGAHNVLLDNQAPADAPGVALADGSQAAYIPLHWTVFERGGLRQTPNGITFTAPSDSNAHGDYIDPNTLLDWNLGAVDASHANHTITVGAVTQGVAFTK